MPQVNESLGTWAYKSGVRKAYTMVSDFGPGHDARSARSSARSRRPAARSSARCAIPVANPDFSAFVQRAKDLNPEAIYILVPGGAQPAAIGKALAERGIDPNKTKILGTGRADRRGGAEEHGRRRRSASSPPSTTTTTTTRAMNKEFVEAYNDDFKRNPDIFSVGGYDGMHLIYEALKKTGGKTDGDALIAAAKGMKWESPRGPMSIDPETRDVVQTVYIRRVEKVGGAAASTSSSTSSRTSRTRSRRGMTK